MNTQGIANPGENLSAAESEQQKLKKLIARSDLIFAGTVLSVGKPPDAWSGYFPAYQTVRYKIEKILKGQYGGTEISVDHVVVSGSKTAQPGNVPRLSSKLFFEGAKLLVFAQKSQSGIWKDLSENLGALPHSEDWLARIEAALRTK